MRGKGENGMSATELFLAYMLKASKYALILLSIAIIVRCIRSMLREQYEPETWAYIRPQRRRARG